jgi:hypothetical protein
LVALAPCLPVVAGLRHDVRDLHVVEKVIWAFEYRPNKTGRQMPCNMAMEGPDTRVILVPLQNNVRVRLELGNVAPRWVGWVGHRAIPTGTEFLKSLASSAVSHDTIVVLAWTSAVESNFTREARGVAWRRSTRSADPTSTVKDDFARVTARAFRDDLDVVA